MTVFGLFLIFGLLDTLVWQGPLQSKAKSTSTTLSFKFVIMAPKSTPAPPSPAPTAVQTLWKAYNEQTPDRLKFIDSFLVFIMLSGIMQFLYCILVTNFPFNAFLSGYVFHSNQRCVVRDLPLQQFCEYSWAIRVDRITAITGKP
jgi:DAD family.